MAVYVIFYLQQIKIKLEAIDIDQSNIRLCPLSFFANLGFCRDLEKLYDQFKTEEWMNKLNLCHKIQFSNSYFYST